jgi:hypothetical protein
MFDPTWLNGVTILEIVNGQVNLELINLDGIPIIPNYPW